MKDDQRLAFLREVFAMQSAGKLSSTSTKNLISDILKSGAQPDDLEKYAAEQGYIQVSDEAEIAKIVAQVIQENPQAAQDVKNGEQKAIGFLTGQVMKKSLGKANPALAQELIKRQLT
jgi:aspartyl-tRNA(Asn)/glutamyl-tRNA(Gln) amidotransferase subunit B